MKKKVYNFVDAQEMHRLHPDTFEVPTDMVSFETRHVYSIWNRT